MKERLRKILKGRVVIVGIGHVLRSDDGLGPELIRRLGPCGDAVSLDAGTAPESYVGKIVRENPDTILLVDAVHLGREPGAWDILKGPEIAQSGLTTHDLSPRMFIEYMANQTKADIYLLGIQPQNVSLGEGLSPAVSRTVEEVLLNLKEVLTSNARISSH